MEPLEDDSPTQPMTRPALIESCIRTRPATAGLTRDEPMARCVALVSWLDAEGRGSVSFPIERLGTRVRVGANAFWRDPSGREVCVVCGPRFATVEAAELGLLWRLQDIAARGGM